MTRRRSAIQQRIEEWRTQAREGLIDALYDPISDAAEAMYGPCYQMASLSEPRPQPEPDGVLWWDLRPSEALELYEAVKAAHDRARSAAATAIMDELVGVAERFAKAHPEARLTP